MKDPAFLFYSQDFFTGVATLDWEDRGKYITLLCLMHQKGRMDEKTISFLVGSVSVNLRSKFRIDENGLWFNERLELESEKRAKFTESRRNNGLLGGRPKKKKASAKAKDNLKVTHMANHMEDENENENKDVIVNRNENKKSENFPFEMFWDTAAHKEGKDDTRAYWEGKKKLKNGKRMNDTMREHALSHYQRYIFNIEDLQFARRPKSYLYNSTFNDEITINQRSKKNANGIDPDVKANVEEFARRLERGEDFEPLDSTMGNKAVPLSGSKKIIEI